MPSPQFALRPFTYTIAANGTQSLEVSGNLVSILEATAKFKLSIDSCAPLTVERGLKFSGYEYGNLVITNFQTVAITITIICGYGEINDQRPLVTNQASTQARLLYSGTPGNVAGAAAVCDLATSIRKNVTLVGLSTNTGDMYLASAQNAGKIFTVWRPGMPPTVVEYQGDAYVYGTVAADFAFVFGQYYT